MIAVVRERYLLLVPAALAAVLGVLIVGWAIDNALHASQVHRNVSLEGRALGGATEESVSEIVSEVAADLGDREVTVQFDGQQATATAGDLGLALDEQAVVDDAMAVGRSESLPVRPFTWLGSIFSDRTVTPEYTVSETQLSGTLQLLYESTASEETIVAQSPRAELADGEFSLVPGQPGRGLDMDRAAGDLVGAVEAAEEGEEAALTVQTTEIEPNVSNEEAQELVDRANTMTADGFTLVAGGAEREVSPAELRGWITPIVDPQDALNPDAPDEEPPDELEELSLVLDNETVETAVTDMFSDLNAEPVDAAVRLSGGQPEVVESEPGVSCCGDDASERIWDALEAGETNAELDAEVVEPEHTTEEVESWGIEEPVGGRRGWRNGQGDVQGPRPGFTTWEACCGSRQHNIRRMADAVNGAVIPPGGTFSINDHVGARECPPYQEAGAIVNNEHVDECGGGTSQFGTTFFNAAFFAGLDITTYRAHSEYFGRYPRGREATMGAPGTGLDVALHNNTEYGVLIQTSYEGDALTVTMWSTDHIQAEQTDISESASGDCDVVTTTRTRTYPDGSEETDTFSATYRPGEGETC